MTMYRETTCYYPDLLEQLLSEQLEDEAETMTSYQLNAHNNAVDAIAKVREVLVSLGDTVEDDEQFPKLSFKKGPFGSINGAYGGYVNRVRGRARLEVLCDMLATISVEVNMSAETLERALLDIKSRPHGSITAQFKDEEYTEAVARAITSLTYALCQLDHVTKMTEKGEDAEF